MVRGVCLKRRIRSCLMAAQSQPGPLKALVFPGRPLGTRGRWKQFVFVLGHCLHALLYRRLDGDHR